MRRPVKALAALALTTAVAGCGGGPTNSAAPVTVTVQSTGDVVPTASSAVTTEPPATQSVEPTDATTSFASQAENPLAGLDGGSGRQVSAEADPVQAIVENAPADGTQVWGQDGCVWTVAQGYWVQGPVCRVPDANGDPNIFFLYTLGTDPQTAWWREVDIDPAVTANGSYFTYIDRNTQFWMRCHTDCSNTANYEIYDGSAWYTFDQVNAAYQQAVTQSQQAQAAQQDDWTTAMLDSMSVIGPAQGAPTNENEAIIAGIMNNFNNDIIETILAPECNSSYNGCA